MFRSLYQFDFVCSLKCIATGRRWSLFFFWKHCHTLLRVTLFGIVRWLFGHISRSFMWKCVSCIGNKLSHSMCGSDVILCACMCLLLWLFGELDQSQYNLVLSDASCLSLFLPTHIHSLWTGAYKITYFLTFLFLCAVHMKIVFFFMHM